MIKVMPMALTIRSAPSSSRPLEAVIAPTLASKRTGPSREYTAAVRLRSSSRISAEASASTRRRDLPREPRWFGEVGTAGRVVVMVGSLGDPGSGGDGDGAVGDGEECLLEGGGPGL